MSSLQEALPQRVAEEAKEMILEILWREVTSAVRMTM